MFETWYEAWGGTNPGTAALTCAQHIVRVYGIKVSYFLAVIEMFAPYLTASTLAYTIVGELIWINM